MKLTGSLKWLQNFSGFDYFVLTGAAINVIVIAYLVGYWLLYG